MIEVMVSFIIAFFLLIAVAGIGFVFKELDDHYGDNFTIPCVVSVVLLVVTGLVYSGLYV